MAHIGCSQAFVQDRLQDSFRGQQPDYRSRDCNLDGVGQCFHAILPPILTYQQSPRIQFLPRVLANALAESSSPRSTTQYPAVPHYLQDMLLDSGFTRYFRSVEPHPGHSTITPATQYRDSYSHSKPVRCKHYSRNATDFPQPSILSSKLTLLPITRATDTLMNPRSESRTGKISMSAPCQVRWNARIL